MKKLMFLCFGILSLFLVLYMQQSRVKEKQVLEPTINQLAPTSVTKEENKRKYEAGTFQAGINVLVYGTPSLSDVSATLERIQSLGFNSVTINFPFFQADARANSVYPIEYVTPTDEMIVKITEIAKELDLYVTLRPIMDEENLMREGMWRGNIRPTDVPAWFHSYEKFLGHYANLAESAEIDAFNIGTELNSLQQYDDAWQELITFIREIYQGDLLYSFNWDATDDMMNSQFAKELDYIGLDAYFSLEIDADATVNQLKQAWEREIGNLPLEKLEKPLIITEAGIIPQKGAYKKPYMWHLDGTILDWQTQAYYYDATFQVWEPHATGIYWWATTLDANDVLDYSPLYSPTEKVIQKQLLKDK